MISVSRSKRRTVDYTIVFRCDKVDFMLIHFELAKMIHYSKSLVVLAFCILGFLVNDSLQGGSSSPGRPASPGRPEMPSSASLTPVEFCSPDYKLVPTEKQIVDLYEKLQTAFKDYDEIYNMVKDSLDLFHHSMMEADSHTKIKKVLRTHEIRVCTMQAMILNILESSQNFIQEN